LLVAMFIAAAGQLRPWEAGASAPCPDGVGLDSSAFDDELAALPDSRPPERGLTPSALLRGHAVILCSRLVVLDLFRPPMAASV
jgi:hypothetical protein